MLQAPNKAQKRTKRIREECDASSVPGRDASEAKKPALDLQAPSMAQGLLQAAPSTPPPRGFHTMKLQLSPIIILDEGCSNRCGRQIPPTLPTMAEAAEPTKNDVIDMAQARPERKLLENPLTWWGDTPWLLWNFNYGASRAPAP